ncbi:sugar phosphate isomerase/epimerase family protein [Paracoccus litorisediminis]|uniref:TIM barrel protein n=1 Tax=Paracoccus litorisediminis TaxID=2006130 RepID=A0A844HX31_9RHOB|nr:TIM barrel protein [Paracoccus litorisediminis]MTH62022.1 TIM barrel protein [Paracoccus litorisediminis]
MILNPAEIALAQLGMTDEGPVALVRAAAAAGFAAVGLPLRSGALRPLHTEIVGNAPLIRDIRHALADTGLRVFDVEALVLGHLPPEAELQAMLETASTLGASRVSCLGHEPIHGPGTLRPGGEVEALAMLCELASSHGLRIGVEFMAFRAINSLGSAAALIRASGATNAGIVVDALHAFRTNATAAEIAALPPGMVSHLQICDAHRLAPSRDALAEEARRGRLLPGNGAIPLRAYIDALPEGTPLSVELPVEELLSLPVAERARRAAASLATLQPVKSQ